MHNLIARLSNLMFALAGAALTAKYLVSGETELVVDLADAGLTPAEVADSRIGLAESNSEVSALNPYTVTVARGEFRL